MTPWRIFAHVRVRLFQLLAPGFYLPIRPVEVISARSTTLFVQKAIQCGEMQLIQEPKAWEQASGLLDYPYERGFERSTAAATD
jgi:hypothetical protein